MSPSDSVQVGGLPVEYSSFVGRRAELAAARTALGPAEWRRFAAMMSAIAAINALGWGIFLLAVQPHHFHYQGLGVGLGVALTAWTVSSPANMVAAFG